MRDAQTTLLVLGGILVTLAALIFAVVTWRHSSPGVRAGVLVGITALAAIAPTYLARRRLHDTAQTFAALACALVAVDALLTRHLIAPALDGRSFWAATTAVLAAAYFVYGRVTKLVSPSVCGILAAQPSLLLASYRVSHTYGTAARFLLAVVVLDGLLVWQLSRTATPGRAAQIVRRVAAGCGAALWVIGLGYLATDIRVLWQSPADVVADAACLLAFTGVAVAYGVLRPVHRGAAAVIAAMLGYVAIVVAGLSATHATAPVSVAGVLAVTGILALAVAAAVRTEWRSGLVATAGLGVAAAAATIVAQLLRATGFVLDGRAVTALAVPQAASLLAVILSVVTAVVLIPALVSRVPQWWPIVGAGGVVALVAAAPLVAATTVFTVGVVALMAAAALVAATLSSTEQTTRRLVAWALGMGLAGYGLVVLRFDVRGLAMALAAIAVLSAASAFRNMAKPLMTGTVVGSTYGAIFAGWSTLTSLSLPATLAALVVPVVVSGALVVAERTGKDVRTASGQAAEAAAIGVGAVSAMSAAINDGIGWFAWSLTVLGIAALAQAVRRGRGEAAYSGLALLTLSSWIQLSLQDVHTVEAYTVPAAFILLGIGLVRRRSDETLSSSSAYAPGLLLGLVPSLLYGLHEGPSTRAGLVLVAAALTAVLGARARLSAPLVIGSCVALLDAVWLGAPTLASLPRWATLGMVGAALLFVGATYEKRRTQAESVARHVRDLV